MGSGEWGIGNGVHEQWGIVCLEKKSGRIIIKLKWIPLTCVNFVSFIIFDLHIQSHNSLRSKILDLHIQSHIFLRIMINYNDVMTCRRHLKSYMYILHIPQYACNIQNKHNTECLGLLIDWENPSFVLSLWKIRHTSNKNISITFI